MRIAKLWVVSCDQYVYCPCLGRFCAVMSAVLVLTACSPHPLPEDVTGLPIYKIVNRIQCEAAQTVRAVYHGRGYSSLDGEYRRVKKFIEEEEGKLTSAKEKLTRNSDFGTTIRELQDARASIELQLLQISEAAARVVSPGRGPEDEDLQNEVLNRLEAETKQLAVQLEIVRRAEAALQRKTTHENALKTARAELGKGGSLEDFVRFQNHTAVFEFEFEVTETNNATSDGTITWPITLGVITLSFDVGDNKSRANKRVVKVISTFEEFLDEEKHNCWHVAVSGRERLPRRYPITGKIGLDEMISDYLVVDGGKGRKFFTSDNKSYTNTITFTTTISGGLNPRVNLSKRMGQLIDANVDVDLSREDIHKVIVFLKPDAVGTKPTATPEVIIKQMPAVRTRSRIIRGQPTG